MALTPLPYVQAPYISAHSRVRVVVILLIAGAILSALIIPVELAKVLFPEFSQDQELADNPGGLVALLLHGLLAVVGAAIFIATVIVFLMWLYRSSNNLPAFGFWRSQGYSPGWAVGSFFVPFVNLVVPYQAVKEIWQKSRPADSQSFSFSNVPPGFFPAWWGFWLCSNFATNIHLRMSGGTAPREATAIVGIVSEILSIAAAGFAIQVVREIDRRQEAAIKHVSPTQHLPVPPPPPIFHPSDSRATNPGQSATPPADAGPTTESSG